jgi:hypothetical protein
MRNVTTVLAAGIVLALLVLVGCPNPDPGPQGPTVYTSGYYYSSAEGHNVACCWNGTVKTDLPVPTGANYAIAKSIFVDGGVVYAAGFYFSGTRYVPCYWDGSTWHDLKTIGTNPGYAQSIFVYAGMVYTAGYCWDGSKDVACCWAGTTRIELPAGGFGGQARSIWIDGGTVYVGGSVDASPEAACYWTDASGTFARIDLPVPGVSDPANGWGICVDAGTVYVAGRSMGFGANAQACYWSDDGETLTQVPLGGFGLSDVSCAMGIDVESGTVFTTGGAETSGGGMASCLWVGTEWTGLTAPDSSEIYANGIDVLEGIPYICGSWYDADADQYIPCFWSGTSSTGITRQDLPGSDTTADTFGIFVVE